MSTFSSQQQLARLAAELARWPSVVGAGPAVVGVEGGGREPVLAVAPLAGRHPLELLLGASAPSRWQAVAVVAEGTVVGVFGGAAPRAGTRVTAVSVTARHGGEVSLVVDGGGHTLVADTAAEGLVPDAARRFLGLATPAPSDPVARWWAVEWLAEVVHVTRQAPQRCSARHVVAAHPAVDADEVPSVSSELVPFLVQRGRDHAHLTGWDGVRASVAAGLLVDPACPAGLAAWFDAGAFSRYAAATRPSVGALVAEVAAVATPGVVPLVEAVLDGWGVVR